MEMGKLVFVALFLLGMICEVIAIGFIFYIGRTRIKEIDRVVLGYEFPNDSIFTLMLRVPNYAGAFICKWCARRSGLEGKVDHFSRKFRWPFIAVFILTFFGFFCMVIGSVLDDVLIR